MDSPKKANEQRGTWILPLVFGGTLLLSATLLFSVQPLAGKLLLPLLGGAPAVWNTVMVFFQAMLLAGYAYAHFGWEKLGLRFQPWLQVLLLLIAVVQLPFTISTETAANLSNAASPALATFATLAKTMGLPIFVLASTAPLLQRWFACTKHRDAGDPYFLYAASNLGSFGALFAYPLLIEPVLRIQSQIHFWRIGFWILTVCIAVTALCLFRWREEAPLKRAPTLPSGELSRATIWKWIGLSFVPSSLMLGVTNYITTDVASVPLLWVIPLGLYLFTFIIAFGRHSGRAAAASSRCVPVLALAVAFPMLVQATEPVWVFLLLHLLFFLFAALQCHLKLARSRPAPEHLTKFYLYLSIGGVLGGAFNALLAPVLFSSVAEYPLMIIAATLIGFPQRSGMLPALKLPAIYGGALVIAMMAAGAASIVFVDRFGVLAVNTTAAAFLLAAYFLFRTPTRYALALGTLLLLTPLFQRAGDGVLEQHRNFFGVLRVTDHPEKPLRLLYHGTTIHGIQSLNPERRCQPLSYYHPEGPVGAIYELYRQEPLPKKVGIIGLGAGAMISYSRPGEQWVLYEIDPAVVRIAQDTNYFAYLSECANAPYEIKLGDARLRLRSAEEGSFGVLCVDAFSSDVIPMHLLTLEAMRLYRSKLASNGILAFHISSRHFELDPLIANLAAALGLECYGSKRAALNAEAMEEGGTEANWVIVVPGSYARRLSEEAWKELDESAEGPLWTDDFSSLAGVLRF